MKKRYAIPLCIIISLVLSIIIVSIISGKNKNPITKDVEKANKFLVKEDSKDIVSIKKQIIQLVEEEKKVEQEKVLSQNPKDIFKNNNVVMIGDSFVEGMACYEILYPSNAIYKRGVRIDNIDEQLLKAMELVPDKLVLMYGANDIQIWKSNVDQFIHNYEEALQKIKEKLPNIKIYICAIFPPNEKGLKIDPAYKFVDIYNEKLEELCKKENIVFLNSNKLLLETENSYQGDGIHIKPSFYNLWVRDLIIKMELK